MSTDQTETSFPRLTARTLRFTLGAPRQFTISPDGERIVFLRSLSGTDRSTELWSYDVGTGRERRIADPSALLSAGDEDLSPEERARRERTREGAAGIVGYATDRDVRVAAFALSSRAWLADLISGEIRKLPTATPVLDPRPSPDGAHVAYVSNGALRVVETATGEDRALATPDGDNVVWGLAEFIAAEEMDRTRGYWWAPDGRGLLVERYDESPVETWHIADPAHPASEPRAVRYPAAGTPNAEVSVWYVDVMGNKRRIDWDTGELPYLANVSWSSYGPPLLHVFSRDQRTARVLRVSIEDGSTEQVSEARDDAWVNILPGVPAWAPDGRLVTIGDDGETQKLLYDGEPATPDDLQVSAVVDITANGVLVTCTSEPTEQHLALVGYDRTTTLLTKEPGVHGGRTNGDVLVVGSHALTHDGLRVKVLDNGETRGEIASRQVRPPFTPEVSLVRLGSRELRAAVLFPRGHTPGTRLPLLLDPYGGPNAQRVRSARSAYLASQWLADQGFCVVVADGRGTPNRGRTWERSVLNDLVSTLDDQVEVVEEIGRRYADDVDLARVAIRGWSYGGYLSALAVLRRPDVFHAGVAGAPVTDWALYDTCYTERYLGDPNVQPDVYDRNGLLSLAITPPTEEKPNRPLLIVHGLADDNVVAAHTLRLSSALLAAGRQHRVLPLSGVTHMTPQEVVAENLLRLEVAFLYESLGLTAGSTASRP